MKDGNNLPIRKDLKLIDDYCIETLEILASDCQKTITKQQRRKLLLRDSSKLLLR